ncbi:hypothetical protein FRC09_008777 [Ceratobasidium sp. 395]|nr:hypothetical protein FRC09_008777 [Ceratobasidium sp. 395]
MATIHQHYKREENMLLHVSRFLQPAVRFADLPRTVGSASSDALGNWSDVSQLKIIEAADYMDDVLALGQSMHNEHEGAPAPQGNPHYFEAEVTNGVMLTLTQLADMLSDYPTTVVKPSLKSDLLLVELLPAQKHQKVDEAKLAY